MAKTPITALLRIGWDTVGSIVARVVADRLDADRLDRLVMIGVEEISYRRGQRYLTQVCDHRTGAIVWASPGRNAATLQAFFDQLGERGTSIRAVSIDMNGGYEKAIRAGLPGAEICFDPFHVVQLAGRAVEDVRRAEWRTAGKSKTGHGRWVKGLRWSLLKAPERQAVGQLAALHEVGAANKRLYRAFLLKEELRSLYHLPDPALAERHLSAWLAWASRSKIKAFVKLARTLRARRDPPRALQRPHGRPQQQGAAALTPLLRLPRTEAPHRPHLPLLRRGHGRAAVAVKVPLKRPEHQKFQDGGSHHTLYRFSPDDYKDIDKIWKGQHPEDGGELVVEDGPPGRTGEPAGRRATGVRPRVPPRRTGRDRRAADARRPVARDDRDDPCADRPYRTQRQDIAPPAMRPFGSVTARADLRPLDPACLRLTVTGDRRQRPRGTWR